MVDLSTGKAITMGYGGDSYFRNNAIRQQREYKPVENNRGVNLTLTMKDVLELIPSYSGDMCEFVRFKHGCKEALNLIGSENEMTLLLFLKLKLQGLIYAQLSLHLSKYNNIQMLLDHLVKDHPFIDSDSVWKEEFNRIRQKEHETIDLYARRFQYVLQCVRIHFDCDYVIDMDNELFRMVKIDNWERIAKYYFIQNLISVKLQLYLAETYNLRSNLDGLMRLAYQQYHILKEKSTCKLCLEENHADDNCIAMKRNYYVSFKAAVSKKKYKIINHEDDPLLEDYLHW